MTDEDIDEWMTRYDERPKLREVVLQLLADKRSLLAVARAAKKSRTTHEWYCASQNSFADRENPELCNCERKAVIVALDALPDSVKAEIEK